MKEKKSIRMLGNLHSEKDCWSGDEGMTPFPLRVKEIRSSSKNEEAAV